MRCVYTVDHCSAIKVHEIYTMEYYSAIKKNSFESVLMRWMKLEPIIQSEVSQKDKDQYSTRIYMEFRSFFLNDGGSDPDDDSRGVLRLSGLVIFWRKSAGLSDAPDMGYEKNRQLKTTPMILTWAIGKWNCHHSPGKAVDAEGLGETSSSVLNMQNLRCLLEIQVRVSQAATWLYGSGA